MANQLNDPIVLNNNQRATVREDLVAPPEQPAVDIVGANATLRVARSGSLSAADADNTAALSSGENARVINRGSISGTFNGVSSTGDQLRLVNSGLIRSDSRAVDLSDGDGIQVRNTGSIIGTGNQRNGTLYVDGTVDNLAVNNTRRGVIDAGEGNLGDAFSLQVGAEGDASNDNIRIDNDGLLQGRGDGSEVFADGGRVTGNGSSGLRFFNGSGLPQATVSGSISNSGTITSEVNVGFLGGLLLEDGVAFQGQIVNERRGLISGPRNGLYIGNAAHNLDIINQGRIESGSRAVNIDGTGVDLVNAGQILGTGNQRNGTVYSDATADNYSIVNERRGVIDAGEGNQGAGISLQTGEVDGDVVNVSLTNKGRVQGRGNGEGNLEGDGIRLSNDVGDTTVASDINNSGQILGSDDGIDIRAGITLDGSINNQQNSLIRGEQTGIEIEGAIANAINNNGTIAGGVNAIDASQATAGVTVNNQGQISGNVVLSGADDVFNSNGRVDDTVFGLAGDDILRGDRGHNTLVGGVGNDTLLGGGETDTFVFTPTDIGADVINDFQNGIDQLDVSAFNLGTTELQSIISNAQQLGGNALLTFGNENTALLEGVQAQALDTSDFIA